MDSGAGDCPQKEIEHMDLGAEYAKQMQLSEQETDLPETFTREDMDRLVEANLYFIADDLATPNYRYCKLSAPIYEWRIGAWRQPEADYGCDCEDCLVTDCAGQCWTEAS